MFAHLAPHRHSCGSRDGIVNMYMGACSHMSRVFAYMGNKNKLKVIVEVV